MPQLKPNHIFVTDTEDAAITKAALSDPDARPLTDAEWKAAKPFTCISHPKSEVSNHPNSAKR